MSIIENEIEYLLNDEIDLNEQKINIIRRLGKESNNDSSVMISKISTVFSSYNIKKQNFQEMIDGIMTDIACNDQEIRSDLEAKFINILLDEFKIILEKIIELSDQHSDAEICVILDDILYSEEFEKELLQVIQNGEAFFEFVNTLESYILESQRSESKALIFSSNQNVEQVQDLENDNVPKMRP